MDLDAHLDRLRSLLDAERDAESQRFAEATAKLSLAERAARGMAAVDLQAADEEGLAGRALVTFAPAPGRDPGGAQIGVGSPVRVVQRREVPEDAPSGIVARRTRGRIAVAFDQPPPDWVTEGRVVLELLPSPVTYERLAAGLRRMHLAPRWHPPLRGEPLRFLEAERGPLLETALNPEQAQALALADRAQDLALVHGPPGTGKTTVLVEVVRRAAARGESVLASAPSNLAVDNLVERLAAAGLNPVRIGHPARVLPAVLEHTLEARVREHDEAKLAARLVKEALQLRQAARKQRSRRGPGRFSESRAQEREARALLAEAREREDRAEADVLEGAQVVLATLTGLASNALRERRFDLAVVDEATQAVEPAAYLALLKADRAVLAGDHLQLPPTVLSEAAQRGGLAVSLFERVAQARPEAMVSLSEQHRMNERIMRYPSEALYGGKLRAHPSVARHSIDEAPLEVIDTAGRGFDEATPAGSESKANPGEAELVAAEAQRLLARGVPPREMAVIAPYDAQVQLLRQLLAAHPDLEVDTVDGFQGREKEAVIVSLTRSNEAGELGFLADIRRMNVALTRARKKLVVVGDGATVRRHPFYDGFFRYAEGLGAWQSAWTR
ncbi:MAG TPA: AAA domain-containing protein [Myxococcales bacterium]|nr:AAA domain-containing protein [Myxococcales bacterium]